MSYKYTVQSGDTLSEIAHEYYSTYGSSFSNWQNYMNKIASVNKISNVNLIYVGQKIELQVTSSTADAAVTKSTTSTVTVDHFGLQANTDKTIFATWSWSKDHTDHYSVRWQYATGDGVWFEGSFIDVKEKQSIYTAPSNATKVRFRVKPVSTKKKVDGKETSYWTGDWSVAKEHWFVNDAPSQMSTPTVTLDGLTLTAVIENIADNRADQVQFNVVMLNSYNNMVTYNNGVSDVVNNRASYSCTVAAGGEYQVRCRAINKVGLTKEYGDYSNFSSSVSTVPSAPSGITTIKAMSETSIYLAWNSVATAETYDIEYTTNKSYFDGSDGTSTITGIESTNYTKTQLESGHEYFFRVRAVNDSGRSPWSDIKSVVIGEAPAAPTTWSSTTKGIVGENVILYWVHNAKDNSNEKTAEVSLTIDGVTTIQTVNNPNVDGDEDDQTTQYYTFDTSSYSEGAQLTWRVRTKGITNVFGDWSVTRTVDIYAQPVVLVDVLDDDNWITSIVYEFPFYIVAETIPNTQTPIGYHVEVKSLIDYDTVDYLGNDKRVRAGDSVYSKYFDTSNNPLVVEMSAEKIDLSPGGEYNIVVTATMDSGLTADNNMIDFEVIWQENRYEPNAEIAIDEDKAIAYISPHCKDGDGNLVSGVTLSVYRREFDGSFTELATRIPNNNTYISDPHPALDYARYRIVATTTDTGSVSYYDMPGYPIGEKAIIIQWDEEWSSFQSVTEDSLVEQPWNGSMLKLPYNVDISDSHNQDVSLIEYIGREHPVSYYGTQVGHTSIWNTDIDKRDEETLYALRRLARWMGNVYVREPSGSGYWANISVSFSQKHTVLTIPVTLTVTRVEGGA